MTTVKIFKVKDEHAWQVHAAYDGDDDRFVFGVKKFPSVVEAWIMPNVWPKGPEGRL